MCCIRPLHNWHGACCWFQALGAVLPGSATGPFAQAGLDEPLGLAIGLRVVRLGEAVLDAQGLAGLGEQTRAVGRAVVSEQTLNAHTQGRVVGNGSLQKVHRRAIALIGMHLHEAHAAVVIDSHKGELPTSAIDRVTAVAGDAVAGRSMRPSFLVPIQVREFTALDLEAMAVYIIPSRRIVKPRVSSRSERLHTVSY